MQTKKTLSKITASAIILELLFGLSFVLTDIAHAKQSKYSSTGKAFETDIMASADGTAYLAFEDGRNRKRVRVRKLENNIWQDLAGSATPNGLISAGVAMNPVLETNGGEVYAAFTDKSDNNRVRVKKWDGSAWSNVADENYPEGKISELGGIEPEISFDTEKNKLFVAFRDEANGNRVRVMSWNGAFWENCADAAHPLGLVSESTAVEVNIASSQTDDSMYIAYQDASQNNRVRVKKWDGSAWSDLSDAAHPDGYLSADSGFNPSITVDPADNVYVAYPNPREGYLHVARWNGSEWGTLVAPSSKKVAEVSLVTDDSNGLWIAFSEKYKKNRWALKLKKYANGNWIDVPFGNKKNKFIAKGKEKVDPAISFGAGSVFVSFTDPGKGRKARVISYNAAVY